MTERRTEASMPDAIATRRLLRALAVTQANSATICATLDAWRRGRPSPYLTSGPHLYIEAVQGFDAGVWEPLGRAYADWLRRRGATVRDVAVIRAWRRIRRRSH